MRFIHTSDWHLGNRMHDTDSLLDTEKELEAVASTGREKIDQDKQILQKIEVRPFPGGFSELCGSGISHGKKPAPSGVAAGELFA